MSHKGFCSFNHFKTRYPNVKGFNQLFLLSALLSYPNKKHFFFFYISTSPGPIPVNSLLFWSAHALLPVSWCFRWRQRGPDCEAGGGSVCWVYELADVLLVWMSWKHTHVHTHLVWQQLGRRDNHGKRRNSFLLYLLLSSFPPSIFMTSWRRKVNTHSHAKRLKENFIKS